MSHRIGVAAPRLVLALALVLLTLMTRDARADLPQGPRFGVLPGAGVGMAGFTNAPQGIPGFVGLTSLQIEIVGELPDRGLFLRPFFQSSGNDGRWTAPGVAAGVGYRFFGDGETSWSLVGRGGLMFERWHASTGGCPIPYFIPDNCKNFVEPTLTGHTDTSAPINTVTVNTLGLLAGARLELPVQPVFMALGGEIAGLADVSAGSPGAIFQAQLTFTISFRNHQATSGDNAEVLRAPASYNPRNK